MSYNLKDAITDILKLSWIVFAFYLVDQIVLTIKWLAR